MNRGVCQSLDAERCVFAYPCLEFVQYAFMHGRVGDNASTPIDLGFTSLKLWLDQRYYPCLRREEWYDGGQDETQGDKRDIDGGALDRLWQAGQVANVGMFHNNDTRIVTQCPC